MQSLIEPAQKVLLELQRQNTRLVLAESCTGGLLACVLTTLPGVSEVFCGSAVTYRNDTKSCWIDVSREKLADPTIGPVSHDVAEEMCQGVLNRTPEADLAAAITGHLGPNAPLELDGVVYIATMRRERSRPTVRRVVLCCGVPEEGTHRDARRLQAAQHVLQAILEELIQSDSPDGQTDRTAI